MIYVLLNVFEWGKNKCLEKKLCVKWKLLVEKIIINILVFI